MSLHGSKISSGSSSMSFRRSTAPRYSQSAYNLSFRPSISSSSYAVQSSSRGLGLGAGVGGFGLGGGGGGFGLGGGAGGLSLGGGSAMMLGGGGMNMDEKNAMQNLNQRLANYLDKVQMLEQSNKDLEKEIRDFAASRTVDGFDWSIYDKTVKPLQHQIHEAILQNSNIALEIDNAKLAAEDFKNKWESELMLRQSVENDIDGLHQLKGTYVQLQSDLAQDIAGLEDEIAYLKKNHEEELKILRQQKTQDVHVEVDSMPSTNLTETLQQLRGQYTELANKNQQDLDNWYKEQVAIKVTQTTQSNQVVDGAKADLSQLRHQMQSLDAEYNSLNGSLSALQNTLNSTEGRYASELQRIMGTVAHLEGELGGIRNNLMSQSQQYEYLLNIKMQLDAELHQYNLLLNGGSQSLISGGSSSSSFSSGVSGKSLGGTTTVVTTTTTEKRGIVN